jgi:hypothetical protein
VWLSHRTREDERSRAGCQTSSPSRAVEPAGSLELRADDNVLLLADPDDHPGSRVERRD